jgi:sugar (pentulose or hexulose) kinase
MAPEWNAGARGCFYGLTPSHGRPHLARALLEGCAFAMRDVADRLRNMGAEIRSLLLLGGGARSRLWAQMRADIMGLPVLVPQRVDTSPAGAAMLAAVAAELVADLRTAGELVREPVAPVAPQAGNQDVYERAYERYRRLFGSLKPMFSPTVSSISALQPMRHVREAGAR